MTGSARRPRVAFVGAGWIARMVWAPLLKEANARICSIIDPSASARLQMPGEDHEVAFHDEICCEAFTDCDVAFICSPNVHHTAHALFALEQGLDVIVEKPACFSLQDAERLIAASTAAGRSIWVTSAASHRDDVQQMMSGVSALGTVHCIDASWRRWTGIPRPGSWFTRRDMAVGGCGADLGWHVLEVALGALGHPLITGALCRHVHTNGTGGARAAAAWRADAAGDAERAGEPVAIEVETECYATLQTGDGALIRLSTAWASHQARDETAFTVYGERGQISLNCTFGFSDNRTDRHELTLLENARTSPLAFLPQEKMSPYRSFVGSVLPLVGPGARVSSEQKAAEHRKLRALASAMQALYPPGGQAGGAAVAAIRPQDLAVNAAFCSG